MKKIFCWFALILITIFCIKSHAQFRYLVSGDTDYFVAEMDGVRYIYPAEYRPLLLALKNYNQIFHKLYEKEFLWQLDEKETLVLASSQNQIANGFATVLPRLHTVYYGNSSEIIDELSVRSWLHVLLIHETAHLYQLNIKHGYSKILKSIFGNSNVDASAFLPPFTYTMYPNAFLPTFVLEGNATYNEGRFGNGGRLYNGAIRGLFLQMLREDLVNATRLMNDHLKFPYGREKYWVGGYFFLQVAEMSEAHKPNLYFNDHAHYNVNPLQVNEAMRDTYGKGYSEIINAMKSRWANDAKNLKRSQAQALFVSDQHAALTKDENEIRVLTTDNKRLQTARIFNRKEKSWTHKNVNLPIGRLFRDDSGALVSTSQEAVNNTSVQSGLFGEGYTFDKKYLSKTVYDMKNDQAVWADAKNSFVLPQIYLNEQKVGESASSALLENSQVFYFKQNQKTRTLYRNQDALFSYQGYYGYPVDAVADTVYFIGPSEFGSSLFAWQRDEILNRAQKIETQKNNFRRVVESDAVVDAKLIDDQNVLIVELTTRGYEYKIVPLVAQSEAPHEYKYFYENSPEFKIFDDLKSVDASAATESLDRPYSSLGDLQFDGIDPMIFFGVDVFAVAQANIRYSDPLQNHNLSLLLGTGSFGEMSTGLFYRNMKNVIHWDLFTLYQKRAEVEEDLSKPQDHADRWRRLDRYDAWLAAAGFDYLFYRRPQWASSLSSHVIYEYEDPNIYIKDIEKTYTVLSSLNLAHAIQPQLAYSSYRNLEIRADHEHILTAPKATESQNIFGGEISGSHDIWHETYLSAKYQTAWTDGTVANIPIDFGPADLPYPTSTRLQRNTSYPDFNFYEASKVTAELKQGLDWGYYFTRFPFSLRRLALLAQYNEYYGSTSHDKYQSTLFHETGGGAEFELLIFHRFPIRLRWMYYESNFKDENTTLITAGIDGV